MPNQNETIQKSNLFFAGFPVASESLNAFMCITCISMNFFSINHDLDTPHLSQKFCAGHKSVGQLKYVMHIQIEKLITNNNSAYSDWLMGKKFPHIFQCLFPA